ncbi:MAG: hypothetical protein WC781_05540 [Candidatus Pacearchaeota archaeon]|jgi:hypothetical protein
MYIIRDYTKNYRKHKGNKYYFFRLETHIPGKKGNKFVRHLGMVSSGIDSLPSLNHYTKVDTLYSKIKDTESLKSHSEDFKLKKEETLVNELNAALNQKTMQKFLNYDYLKNKKEFLNDLKDEKLSKSTLNQIKNFFDEHHEKQKHFNSVIRSLSKKQRSLSVLKQQIKKYEGMKNQLTGLHKTKTMQHVLKEFPTTFIRALNFKYPNSPVLYGTFNEDDKNEYFSLKKNKMGWYLPHFNPNDDTLYFPPYDIHELKSIKNWTHFHDKKFKEEVKKRTILTIAAEGFSRVLDKNNQKLYSKKFLNGTSKKFINHHFAKDLISHMNGEQHNILKTLQRRYQLVKGREKQSLNHKIRLQKHKILFFNKLYSYDQSWDEKVHKERANWAYDYRIKQERKQTLPKKQRLGEVNKVKLHGNMKLTINEDIKKLLSKNNLTVNKEFDNYIKTHKEQNTLKKTKGVIYDN